MIGRLRDLAEEGGMCFYVDNLDNLDNVDNVGSTHKSATGEHSNTQTFNMYRREHTS